MSKGTGSPWLLLLPLFALLMLTLAGFASGCGHSDEPTYHAVCMLPTGKQVETDVTKFELTLGKTILYVPKAELPIVLQFPCALLPKELTVVNTDPTPTVTATQQPEQPFPSPYKGRK